MSQSRSSLSVFIKLRELLEKEYKNNVLLEKEIEIYKRKTNYMAPEDMNRWFLIRDFLTNLKIEDDSLNQKIINILNDIS